MAENKVTFTLLATSDFWVTYISPLLFAIIQIVFEILNNNYSKIYLRYIYKRNWLVREFSDSSLSKIFQCRYQSFYLKIL